MKSALLVAAAFGLSAAAAQACPAHDKHVGADKDLTVASVADERAPMSTPETVADEAGKIETASPATDEAE